MLFRSSQRYADVEELELPSPPEIRVQDLKNRQNSFETDDIDMLNWKAAIQLQYFHAYTLYKNLIKDGVAKECAREVLPMGTPTKLYMNGTLRSWIHYCDLRCGNGTQKEHRAIALDIKQLIKQNYPQVYEVISRFS